MTTDEPTVLRVRRRATDPAAYQKAYDGLRACESDYQHFITEPTLILDAEDERVVAAYVWVEEDLTRLARALVDIPTHEHVRQGGLATNDATFGSRPRNATRQDYCTNAKLAVTHRTTARLLSRAATVVAQAYARIDAERHARHQQAVRGMKLVQPQWLLEETVFTSGVVNRDKALTYHLDRGNVKGGWSGMLGFRRAMGGGHLVLPLYGVALEVADHSLTLFDGQALLHGVTPLVRLRPDAYRLTAVYYTAERMWRCRTSEEEIARFNQRQANR